MSLFDTSCVTDALNWSEGITLTESYASDVTDDDGGRTTKTGTATFGYQRLRFADVLANPKLALTLSQENYGAIVEQMPKGSFLPFQLAVGKMPGWGYLVKDPDPQQDAFTTTYYPPPPDDGSDAAPPTTTQSDAQPNFSLYCGYAAPGRAIIGETVYPDGPEGLPYLVEPTNRFLSLGQGYGLALTAFDPDNPTVGTMSTLYDQSYTVEMLAAGIPASGDAPAVNPVYRVSIPEAVIGFERFSYVLNGSTHECDLQPTPRGVRGQLAAFFGGRVFARSPSVVDVLMENFTDSLAAGTFTYLSLGDNAAGNTSTYGLSGYQSRQTLDDPFNMKGRTLSYEGTGDDDGHTITLQL